MARTETEKQGSTQLELDDVRDVLLHMVSRIQQLNGTAIPAETIRGRDRSAALAPLHKELLFLAHLADKARVGINDEYHRTRGYTEFTDGALD